MDNITISNQLVPVRIPRQPATITIDEQDEPTHKAFIKGNTVATSYNEIKHCHTIPVFVKDNEPTISHSDFIDAVYDAASYVYGHGSVADPVIRLSHPIKGRIPSAKNKPANELYEHEKTIYYERMMFVMDVPCNHDVVDGNHLSLTVGGVKAYNLDNLYNKKGADEHFKVFIGFKNSVCTNLCISTDGLAVDVKVKDPRQLRDAICHLLSDYNAVEHLSRLQQLSQFHLTEKQFAQLLGRCRMYQFLSTKQKTGMTPLLYGDQQLNTICRDYYRDRSFACDDDGNINLWKVYNLFTGACKSTYIDQYLDRSVNAFDLTRELQYALDGGRSWFLQ
jgi:hypothetical protein